MCFKNSIITNQLFYKVYENENSIYNDLKDYKSLLVLDYLYRSVNRDNKCVFTLEHMITYCGLTPRTGSNKSVEQFKSILYYLQNNGYIKYNKNLLEIKPKDFIICEVYLRDDNKFTVLNDYVKSTIMNYNKDKVNNLQMLFYWCYLHSRVHRKEFVKEQDKDNLIILGGRAGTCYVSYKNIEEDIGITSRSVNKYNKILSDLNLLRYDNNGIIIKDGISKNPPNVYCTISNKMKSEDIDKENSEIRINISYGLKQQMYDLNNNGWNKSDCYNNKSLAGKIGALTKLKNKGTATKSQLLQLDELNKSKNILNSKITFKKLEECFYDTKYKISNLSDKSILKKCLPFDFNSFINENNINKNDYKSIEKSYIKLIDIKLSICDEINNL